MNAVVKLNPPDDAPPVVISVAWIEIQPGFNPRTFFAEAEFQELVGSVREHGVLQPVIVRPQEEDASRYWLIAGERRWRAALAAGLQAIPAVVREVDERQALIIATVENTSRQDLSPAEEAQVSRRILDACEGDRDEALRVLGWPATKFEARQLLLHASPAVLQALSERRIKLGHAELLAGLPQKTQDGTLAGILNNAISVADLKARISRFSLPLASALFDKTECLTCPHNSSRQAGLFEDTIGQGRCQNRACYQQKTQVALAARRDALQAQYPAVFLDTDKEPTAYTVLEQDGPTGVGPAQFATCQGCGRHGALLLTAPGREGQVMAGLCFDLSCNRRMVAAWRDTTRATLRTRVEGEHTTPASATQITPVQAQTGSVVSLTPRRVQEAVDRFYRQTAAQVIAADAEMSRAFALYAVLKDAGFPKAVLEPAGLSAVGQRRERLTPALYRLDSQRKDELLQQTLAYLMQSQIDTTIPSDKVATAVAVVSVTATALTGRFTLDEDFLKAYTKAGIDALLREAVNPHGQSFADWWNAKNQDKAAFSRLMARTNAKIIKAVLQSGFDFSQFVPACIASRLKQEAAPACIPDSP